MDGIPSYEIEVAPNYVHPSDNPSSNYNAVWLTAKSPSTPFRGPDSQREVARYMLLDPRFTDADGHRGHDEWWFLFERYWPVDYPADNHGRWGREEDFHNVAGDAGPGAGVGWGFGDLVSALALDWLPNRGAPQFSVQPMWPDHEHLLPTPKREMWQTYLARWVAGRTDGSTVRPGALKVWQNGCHKKDVVIDLDGVDTVQRAKGPDGQWYTQRWMQLWEGDYTSYLPVRSPSSLVLTRIGASLDLMMADRPQLLRDNLAGQHYRGAGPDTGPPTVTRLPDATALSPWIPGVRWDGKVFYTDEAMKVHLAAHGVSYKTWAKKHKAAALILESNPS